MTDRLSHAAALANAEPRAREPRDRTPDFTGLSATIELEDVETPFGVLHGVAVVEGNANGRWRVVEVQLDLGRDIIVLGRHEDTRLTRAIFTAFASAVTEDMAYDALKREGE